MNEWFKIIVTNGHVERLDEAILYFEDELKEARKECAIKGSLEQASARLPGHFEYRYAQLKEIEAILRYMDTELKKIRSVFFKKYKETYNTELIARDIEKYIDGENDVVAWSMATNSLMLIRDQFIGVTTALDTKNWQIGHIVKLRIAGIEDARLNYLEK